jgi:hypothetical protein
MPEHFTKNTVEATVWCKRCGKVTPHRIDDGRRGPCLVCLERPTRPTKATVFKSGLLFSEKPE